MVLAKVRTRTKRWRPSLPRRRPTPRPSVYCQKSWQQTHTYVCCNRGANGWDVGSVGIGNNTDIAGVRKGVVVLKGAQGGAWRVGGVGVGGVSVGGVGGVGICSSVGVGVGSEDENFCRRSFVRRLGLRFRRLYR